MSEFASKINQVEPKESTQEREDAGIANANEVDLSFLLGFEDVFGEGEPDLIVELIDLYLADVPQQLSAMRDAVLKTNEVSLKRAAHTLKGSSANLGVNAVAALCEEIEKTDSSETFQPAHILVNRLEQAFARAKKIFLAERQKRI